MTFPNRPSRAFVALLAFCTLLLSSAPAADFIKSVSAWQQLHKGALQKVQETAVTGDVTRSNAMLLKLAQEDNTGFGAFVVGNMLYRSDTAASYRLHAQALRAFPKEPAVALEMAMEQHRRGEYAAAIGNYQVALKAEMGPQFSALLAECLLRTGQLKEAVAAWRDARHGNNHTGIDFAIYEIHGELLPLQRRADLLAQIHAGDRGKLSELIFLDIHFSQDWWNESVFTTGLDQDLKLAAQLLGEKTPAFGQLSLYARLARQEEPKPGEITAALTAASVIVGKNAILPDDSRLARMLCELAMSNEAAKPADLLHTFAPELRTRVDNKQDREALHLLCLLAAQAEDPQLEAFDRIGWKEWHDTDFAVSYMADLIQAKKLTRPDDPELLAAIQAVPDSNHLCLMRLRLAGETGLTREMLVDAIKAEYHRLSGEFLNADSYTLKSLYAFLGNNLGLTEAPAEKQAE